jgi:hypothetical protein
LYRFILLVLTVEIDVLDGVLPEETDFSPTVRKSSSLKFLRQPTDNEMCRMTLAIGSHQGPMGKSMNARRKIHHTARMS